MLRRGKQRRRDAHGRARIPGPEKTPKHKRDDEAHAAGEDNPRPPTRAAAAGVVHRKKHRPQMELRDWGPYEEDNEAEGSRETHGEDRAVDRDDVACGRGVARDQWLERIHPEAESQYDNLVREYYEAEADYRDQFHAQYVELKKFYDEKP